MTLPTLVQWERDGILKRNLDYMKQLASLNVPLKVIARELEISEPNLHDLKKRHFSVAEALNRGHTKLYVQTYVDLLALARDPRTSDKVRAEILLKIANKLEGEIHGVDLNGLARALPTGAKNPNEQEGNATATINIYDALQNPTAVRDPKDFI